MVSGRSPLVRVGALVLTMIEYAVIPFRATVHQIEFANVSFLPWGSFMTEVTGISLEENRSHEC